MYIGYCNCCTVVLNVPVRSVSKQPTVHVQITELELACSSGWMYIVYACLALPYLAYITVDLNPADWAASVAQLAEHWTSNPVVTG